jgi:hypothetical protein
MKLTDRAKYLEQKKIFIDNFALDFGINNNDRLTLIILICNITQSIRTSNSSVLVIDVIEKIIKDEDVGQGLEEFLIKLSFCCESLLAGDQEPFSSLKLETTKEKTDKIRELVNNYLPF